MDYAQLRGLDTSKLSTAAEAARSLSTSMSQRGSELKSKSDIPLWVGQDSTAAQEMITGMPGPLYDSSDAFKRGGATLEDLVDDLEAAKNKLDDAHDLVAGTPVTISESGSVQYPPAPAEELSKDAGKAYIDRCEAIASQARDLVAEAVTMANTADETASGRLNASGTAQARSSHTLPGIPGGPWNALTDEERDHRIGSESLSLLSMNVNHGDGGATGSGSTDGKSKSISIGPEPDRRLTLEGPQASAGPLKGSAGSVGFHDSLMPGLSFGGEDGKTRLIPKVRMPLVEVSTPNISVDFPEVGNGIKDAASSVGDFLQDDSIYRKYEESKKRAAAEGRRPPGAM